jgi:hypothetical protein
VTRFTAPAVSVGPPVAARVQVLHAAGAARGVRVIDCGVQDAAGLPAAFNAMQQDDIGGLHVVETAFGPVDIGIGQREPSGILKWQRRQARAMASDGHSSPPRRKLALTLPHARHSGYLRGRAHAQRPTGYGSGSLPS